MTEQNALDVARASFLESLPRKHQELKTSLAFIAGNRSETRFRDELKRRFSMLHASAQVFRYDDLVSALSKGIGILSSVAESKRPLSTQDLNDLSNIVSSISVLVKGQTFSRTTSEYGSVDPLKDSATKLEKPLMIKQTMQGLGTADMQGSQQSVAQVTQKFVQPEAAVAMPKKKTGVLFERPSSPGDLPAVATKSSTQKGPMVLESVVKSLRSSIAPMAAQLEEQKSEHSKPDQPKSVQTEQGNVSTSETKRPDEPHLILVLESRDAPRSIARLIREEYENYIAETVEEALHVLKVHSPDLILVHHSKREMIAQIRTQPLSEPVHVVLVGVAPGEQSWGADESIENGISPSGLVARIAGILDKEKSLGFSSLGQKVNVQLLSEKISEEINKGLVESAVLGRDIKVSVERSQELKAAVWALIEKARSALTESSAGKIKFVDHVGTEPAYMALFEDAVVSGDASAGMHEQIELKGRRIVVADDDPSVVWFFSGVLREEGAIVVEASDGDAALSAARWQRPDLIISDIRMPRMDGFAFIREIKKDPALSHVPVIMISWKDDFLQRMKELQSGAQGYLRKEAGASHIIQKVKEALKPKMRFEHRLHEEEDVKGRIETLGVIPILEATAEGRPNSRVVFKDASHIYEVQIRDGNMVNASRTNAEGTFVQGFEALQLLMAVRSGRYLIQKNEGPIRASMKGSVMDNIRRAAIELGSKIDAISGKHLVKVKRLEFDSNKVLFVSEASPQPISELVIKLKQSSPQQLIAEGAFSALETEMMLIDLVNQDAILSAKGEQGEDLVALARLRRENTTHGARRPSGDWPMAGEAVRGAIPTEAVISVPSMKVLPALTERPISDRALWDMPTGIMASKHKKELDEFSIQQAPTEELEIPSVELNKHKYGVESPQEITKVSRVPEQFARWSNAPSLATDSSEIEIKSQDMLGSKEISMSERIREAQLRASIPSISPLLTGSLKPDGKKISIQPGTRDSTSKIRTSPKKVLGWMLPVLLLLTLGVAAYATFIKKPTRVPEVKLRGFAPETKVTKVQNKPMLQPTAPTPMVPGTNSWGKIEVSTSKLKETEGQFLFEAGGTQVELKVDGKKADPDQSIVLEKGIHLVAIKYEGRWEYRFVHILPGHQRRASTGDLK